MEEIGVSPNKVNAAGKWCFCLCSGNCFSWIWWNMPNQISSDVIRSNNGTRGMNDNKVY